MKLKRNQHLLGLGIHNEQVCFVEINRSGDRLHVRRVIEKVLPFAPLTANPVLAGGELRKLLEEAGVQTRHCVINLPLAWVLSIQTALPDLPEEDLASYLALQAERDFPYPADDICRQSSRFSDADGVQYATTLAVSRQRIEALLEIVQRARLKPLSLTLGVSQFVGGGKNVDAIALSVGHDHLEMAILTQGTLMGLRSLDFLLENDENSESSLDAFAVVRQVRLTLAQLPDMIRSRIRSINIFGRDAFSHKLAQDLKSLVAPLGLEVITQSTLPFPFEIADGQPAPDQAVLSSAASYLLSGCSRFEFMPEYVSKLRQFVRRVSARGTMWASGAALAVILITAGAFSWQYHQLSKVETQWTRMEPHVTKVEELQVLVRGGRPWFDETIPSLRLLKQLTEAFPEEGEVWVKSLDIKNMSQVTCSGFARNDRAWLTLHDQLLVSPGVSALEVQQVRGSNPVQFNFTFQWNEVPGNGV